MRAVCVLPSSFTHLVRSSASLCWNTPYRFAGCVLDLRLCSAFYIISILVFSFSHTFVFSFLRSHSAVRRFHIHCFQCSRFDHFLVTALVSLWYLCDFCLHYVYSGLCVIVVSLFCFLDPRFIVFSAFGISCVFDFLVCRYLSIVLESPALHSSLFGTSRFCLGTRSVYHLCRSADRRHFARAFCTGLVSHGYVAFLSHSRFLSFFFCTRICVHCGLVLVSFSRFIRLPFRNISFSASPHSFLRFSAVHVVPRFASSLILRARYVLVAAFSDRRTFRFIVSSLHEASFPLGAISGSASSLYVSRAFSPLCVSRLRIPHFCIFIFCISACLSTSLFLEFCVPLRFRLHVFVVEQSSFRFRRRSLRYRLVASRYRTLVFTHFVSLSSFLAIFLTAFSRFVLRDRFSFCFTFLLVRAISSLVVFLVSLHSFVVRLSSGSAPR